MKNILKAAINKVSDVVGNMTAATVESRQQEQEWPMTSDHLQAQRPKAESDEIRETAEEFEEPSRWRMTRTPQPKATHPGMSQSQNANALPEGALDGFVLPAETDFKGIVELYQKLWWEFRRETARKNQVQRHIIWKKIKLLKPLLNRMNQGSAVRLPDSELNKAVGVAAELHASEGSQYQQWQYAAAGNFHFLNCLKAYDEKQAVIVGLMGQISQLHQIMDSLLETSMAPANDQVETKTENTN